MDKHVHYQQELRDGWIHNSHRNDWRWCPRSFKLRYIEGEVTPQSEIMEMGTVFHDFAADYHKAFQMYQWESFNKLSDLIAWQLSYVPEETMPILKMYVERFIIFECRRYWYYCRALPNADEEFMPRETELALRHRYGDEPYGFAGTIDAVWVIHNDDNIIVRLREYKASRKATSVSNFMGDVRGQLTFYKGMVERLRLYGDDVTFRFELYNPILDNGVFPLETGTFERNRSGVHTPYWFLETPLSTSQKALDKSIMNFLEAVESGYYPKQHRKNIDYKCVYCSFYGLCWGKY